MSYFKMQMKMKPRIYDKGMVACQLCGLPIRKGNALKYAEKIICDYCATQILKKRKAANGNAINQ